MSGIVDSLLLFDVFIVFVFVSFSLAFALQNFLKKYQSLQRQVNNAFWTCWKLPWTTKKKFEGLMKIRRELWRMGGETRIRWEIKTTNVGYSLVCMIKRMFLKSDVHPLNDPIARKLELEGLLCSLNSQIRLEETRNFKDTHLTSYFNRSWIYLSNGLWSLNTSKTYPHDFFWFFFVIFEFIFSTPLLTHNPW